MNMKIVEALTLYIDKNFDGDIDLADLYCVAKPWWFEVWMVLGRDRTPLTTERIIQFNNKRNIGA